MTTKLQRLELTWPGKEERFNFEPRILLEDESKSYSKDVPEFSSPLRGEDKGEGEKLDLHYISSPSRGEDQGEGEKLDLLSFAMIGENQAKTLPVISSPLRGEDQGEGEKLDLHYISSPSRGEDKGEGEKLDLLSFAKGMRHNPTEAEKLLWQHLRNNQLGYKFRRQHQIGNYIVDFVCLEQKLIIECDGGQHNENVDNKRTDFLNKEGYFVIRFWNNEILSNIEGVLCKIKEVIQTPPSSPSPLEGEGISPTFDNMLIHGDNLLALKALEQDYTGKIKCIYIDPPYNTGNAFEHYDDGLEHSIWLSMMRERLEILKRLLSDDGMIFVQIDDNEQAYLKVLMDEIFGRNNFVTTIAVKMSTASGVKTSHKEKTIIKEKEYIHIFAKDALKIRLTPQYTPKDDLSSEFQYYLDKNNSDNPLDWTVRNLKDVLKIENIDKDKSKQFIINNADKIWRRAFIRNEYKELSQKNPDKVFYVNKDNHEHYYYRGREMYFLKDQFHDCFTEDGIKNTTSYLLGDFWTDINTGKLFNEGSVEFRNSKKPEFLIARILHLASNPGDLVLDSFLGSGTTAAVAQKMGRRWIGIEMGDHVYTHCIPRLQKVINGEDQGGITKAVNYKGGGGFKFYELASSLIVKDKYGQQIISEKYNPEMLAEAMCKIMGYKYAPDKEIYWKQGYSSEKNYIYTTTANLQET